MIRIVVSFLNCDAEAKEYVAHKATCEAEIRLIAPAANNKCIAMGVDVTELMKNDIISILEVYYRKQETYKNNKPILVEL
jgi:hypothetical protein